MMTRATRVALAAACCVGAGARARDVFGYPQYSEAGDATYCRACHGDFRASSYFSLADGADWGVDLHILHRDTMLGGDCDTCHSSGGRFPVLLDSSKGGSGLDAISCMGCHGREEDNTDANPEFGNHGGRGAGLRQHHQSSGISLCAACHDDALPANYTPVGEEVAPPYYANPGAGHPAIPGDACNADGSEDLAGQPSGLDNDGDGVYDGSDPDCAAAIDAGLPDASAGQPDATVADASPGLADAALPDAGTGTADAATAADAHPAPPDAAIENPDGGVKSDDGGCACRSSDGSSAPLSSFSLLLLAAFLALRRRA